MKSKRNETTTEYLHIHTVKYIRKPGTRKRNKDSTVYIKLISQINADKIKWSKQESERNETKQNKNNCTALKGRNKKASIM